MLSSRAAGRSVAAEHGSGTLIAYVPRVALDWTADHADASSLVLDGSLVFVDISGFTALSERLARRGRIGAEELTETLSSCFSELLGLAYAQGGSLLKFGGDALLLLFDGADHALRAASSAISMRAAMRSIGRVSTSVGVVRLKMSVGIHSGPIHLFRVGRSHHELIVSGPGASAAVDMESAADAGQIIVSSPTASALPPGALGQPKGLGILLRDRPIATSPSPAPVVRVSADAAPLGVPVALREELTAGHLESEHRRLSVAFIHFDGVDGLLAREGPDAVACALEELVIDVQDAAEGNGVTFLGTDIDRDGGKVILVAGAPRALGDDEGRLLRVVRRIADRPRTLAVRIGVNRGPTFVGVVGPDFRRTYTVMGDAVNLAARVMAKAADGEVLATAAVIDNAATRYEAAPLAPFLVKGKTEPVEAFRVGAPIEGRAERAAALRAPLVGRDEEMATLTLALGRAREGRGHHVVIAGDAGIGKTRLVDEVCDAAAGDMTVVRSFCEPYEATTPYFAFRFLLRGLLGLPEGRADGDALARAVVSVAPALRDWLPLIAAVADVEVEPTEATSRLEPRFRRAATVRAVVDLWRAAARAPAVFLIEDAQWMDNLSAELVDAVGLATAEYPWLLCVVRRDEAPPSGAADGALSITLGPIDDEAARAFVSNATTDAPLLPDVRDALVTQAGGNPLFLAELLRAHASADAAEALPESLEAVVATEIDLLPPDDRRLLRYTAVLGPTFEVALLADLTDGEVRTAAAVARRFGAFVEDAGPGLMRFRNQCYRQVAYDTLPFGRRRELHAKAAGAMERARGGGDGARAASLSLHYFHARVHDRCWTYARLAGDQAQASYANAEAAELYERALLASRHVATIDPGDLAVVWESLGDVSLLVGRFTRATTAYARARSLRAGDPLTLASLCMKQSRASMHQGRSQNALRWIRRGLRLLDGSDAPRALARRAQLATMYANNRQMAGRPRQALAWAAAAIKDAEGAGHDAALASAYVVYDWALAAQGRGDEATHLPRALEIFEGLADSGRAAEVLMYLGVFAYMEGRWADALEWWSRARTAYLGAGNVVDAALGASNSAEVLIYQGRYDEAEPLLADALEVWRAADYPAVAGALSHQGKIALGRGDCAEATRRFDEVACLAHSGGASVAENEGWLAECLLRQGRAADALERIDATLRSEAAAGDSTFLAMLHRVRGYACEALGRTDDADAQFALSLDVGRSRGAPYDLALTLDAVATVAARRGRPVDPRVVEERSTVCRRLDVRSLPSSPLR